MAKKSPVQNMVNKPLENRTIVITRAAAQADEFAEMLLNLGARPVSIPVIEICPLDTPEIHRSLREVDNYSWIIFTSINGAEIFLGKLRDVMNPGDLRPRVCSIGPGTSRQIERMGFPVHMVPKIYQAEGILEEFSEIMSGMADALSVLIPRASHAREILPETLKKMGITVKVVPVYRTAFPSGCVTELQALLSSSSPDMITFTSSSTVTNFIKMAGETFDLHSYKYAAIGPVTSATAAKAGLEITVNSGESTLESLTEAIAEYFSGEVPAAAGPGLAD
ncbi:MAG: uroporphyrinogen-III synthase [Acidobacteriota bacterium]